jgi:hypothetical protein
VVDVIRRLHERRAAADFRPRDAHAVGGSAEVDLLLQAPTPDLPDAALLVARSVQVEPHRAGDILQRILADVLEGDLQLSLDLPVRVDGEAHRSRHGGSLHPRHDIDAIAEEISALNQHVADVHADAQLKRLSVWRLGRP